MLELLFVSGDVQDGEAALTFCSTAAVFASALLPRSQSIFKAVAAGSDDLAGRCASWATFNLA